MLLQYVRKNTRKNTGRRVGVLIAENHEGELRIGWSLCKTREDRFSETRGLEIASGRMNKVSAQTIAVEIPNSMRKIHDKFCKRAQRYFKDATLKD